MLDEKHRPVNFLDVLERNTAAVGSQAGSYSGARVIVMEM